MVSHATLPIPHTRRKWGTLAGKRLSGARYRSMGRISVDGDQPIETSPETISFERFVREQRNPLLGFLRRRVSSEEDAQDIAQESLARLIRYRDHAPETWSALLYRIAINALNDRARRAQTHHANDHVSLDENVHALASSEQAHEHRLDTHQELARVQQALLRLPPRCRDIYLLNRIDGMSYPEIATHCGISVKAVEKQIGKALALLRKQLGELDAGRN